MLEGMQRRAFRILLLFWLGWYLSGPMAEMVDFWDTPPQEIHDIARAGGGMVALIGTALAIVLSQIRKLRDGLRHAFRRVLGCVFFQADWPLTASIQSRFVQLPSHSPPIPLRI